MADQGLSEKSDETLLRDVRAGDRASFTQLIDRHSEKFYRLAFRYMGHREHAEDVVQEAFTKLWQKPEIWDGNRGVKFTTWFYRVIVNLCLDERRKNRWQSLPDGFDMASGQRPQDHAMIMQQEQMWLETEIKKLPPRQQSAINLCFLEGLSNKEAAEIMGLELKALQSLVMRAKETLKRRLMTGEGSKNGVE